MKTMNQKINTAGAEAAGTIARATFGTTGGRTPRPPADRRWVMQDRLLRGEVSGVDVRWPANETLFAAVQAASIATGRDLLGLGEIREPTNVLVVDWGRPGTSLPPGVRAALALHGIDDSEIAGRLIWCSGPSSTTAVAITGEGGRVEPGPGIQAMTELCAEHDVGVVFLPPFGVIHSISPAPWYDTEKAVAVFDILRDFARANNVAVQVQGVRCDAPRVAPRILHTSTVMPRGLADRLGIPRAEAAEIIRLDCARNTYAEPGSTGSPVWIKSNPVKITVTKAGRAVEQTVRVPVPFEIEAHEPAADRAAERRADPRTDPRLEQQIQRTRMAVVYELGSRSEERLTTLRSGPLSLALNASQQATEKRVKDAIPEGRENATLVQARKDSPAVLLWRERIGAGPIMIRQTPVHASASAGADRAAH
jgi:hypothetical protein